ncbi:MAG TPA: hypothetical protein VER75_04370, partial [Thermoleophilaceae bacterium]|nr:hypothetical protein [Thermoleophilaceae bacterium]
MTWTIAVPFRSRDEPLSAVGDAARRAFSTDEDRAVARQLVLGAAADGVATVGGLLDKLEKLGPAQRRSLLD